MRVFPFLLLILCSSTMGAEFSGYGCSDGLCQAKINSGAKTVGLMWGAYVAPQEEFLVATEGNNSGTYYSLLSSDDRQITVGVIAERVLPPKDTLVRRDQAVMIAVKGADGTYSFVPHELVGMGKVVLKLFPEKPGMFSVGIQLIP